MKKEKRFKPQKQKAVIQPNIQFADSGAERRDGAFERPSPPRVQPPHASTFFRDFEAVRFSSLCLLMMGGIIISWNGKDRIILIMG